MGYLEKKVRTAVKNTRLQRTILRVAASVENLTTEMFCGSIYKMYKLIDRHEQERKYHSILSARARLIKNGLLMKKGAFVELTAKGKKTLREWEYADYKVPRPEKWDGKWRILIFDIPERRRHLRDMLRNTLRAIGFKRLQDSVWVYPYDCEDFITLLKADFKIGKDLLYIIGEAVENDRVLRDYFEVYT